MKILKFTILFRDYYAAEILLQLTLIGILRLFCSLELCHVKITKHQTFKI